MGALEAEWRKETAPRLELPRICVQRKRRSLYGRQMQAELHMLN